MLEQELTKFWRELRKVWKNSSQTKTINRVIAREISAFKKRLSGFEKESIARDLKIVNRSIRKFNS